MKIKTKLLVITKNDWPLETVRYKGNPIGTFLEYWLRRFILGKWLECQACYEKRKGIKVKSE